jgi:hypothetical protein
MELAPLVKEGKEPVDDLDKARDPYKDLEVNVGALIADIPNHIN